MTWWGAMWSADSVLWGPRWGYDSVEDLEAVAANYSAAGLPLEVLLPPMHLAGLSPSVIMVASCRFK